MKIIRKKTIEVDVGGVKIGGASPIRIQSMTNTQTSDIDSTVAQIIELTIAGSELVRITVDDASSAKAVPYIIERLKKKGVNIPIIGDFHFNGHILLEKYPDMAKALSKYRINPGNVGVGKKKDDNFKKIIELAAKYEKPVRIGVNSGSLDEALLSENMEKNSMLKKPLDAREVYVRTIVESALISANLARKFGLDKKKIILSVKMSDVQDMILAYELLSEKTLYPLHLGLTEAGGELKGITSSSVALGVLLQKGIGDTIRVSITPSPGKGRTLEISVCENLLQSMGLRFFKPMMTSCPGCGRTNSDKFQEFAKQVSDQIGERLLKWKGEYEDFENTSIAVMGCIVNGPGESKMADIGISLPGKSEDLIMPVYVKGTFLKNLKGDNVLDDFMNIVEDYFDRHFRKSG